MTRPEPPDETDRLAALARAGSLPAFAELVRLHQGRVYNFHRRRSGSAADAADLTQETFLRAWQRLDRYDPARPFTTWLFTLAARASINLHRETTRRARLQARATAPPPAEDPSMPTIRREDTARLWVLADRLLSTDQRTALWLRYAEGLAIAEIALVLGRSRVATRVLLFRARETLARAARRPAPADSAARPRRHALTPPLEALP